MKFDELWGIIRDDCHLKMNAQNHFAAASLRYSTPHEFVRQFYCWSKI